MIKILSGKNFISLLLSLLLIVSIIVAITLYKRNSTNKTYLDTLKEQIDSLNNELRVKDSLYIIKTLEKDKVKVVREKVSTAAEIAKIEKLEQELNLLRSKVIVEVIELTPEETEEYFSKMLVD